MFFAWHDSSMLIFRTHYKEFQDWIAQDVNFQEYWSKQLTKIISHGEYKNIYSRFKKHLIHVLTWRLLHVEILPPRTFPEKIKTTAPSQFTIVRFCQNWAFSTKYSDAKQLSCLPLSFFHWIGDKPFEAGTAPGSIEQVYQSTIIYNASPSFMRLSTPGQSRKITKIGPKLTGPVWKMTKKPPTPWVSIILWVEIIWFIDLPRPYSGQSGIFIINLLLFENNLESDWISR